MPPTPPPQTYRVKSFGCQMNVYDGERMAELLDERGLRAASEDADADLVVLNTCHIREKAAEKVYSDIGRLRRADGSAPLIAVAGCVAQAEGEEIMARAPQAYHRLPQLLDAAAQGRRVTDTDMPAETKFGALPRRRRTGPSAFLTVQEGCDKFCTYCVVPYTRGAEISRPFMALIDEAKILIEAGAKEITLLGQNVNAWRGENQKGRAVGLDDLIAADMSEGLIAAHRDIAKLMPFLHLPVQSGSDRILAAMNRSHSADGYLRLLDKVRAARPDIALSGDFIVGFPGETEADFAATMRLVREVGYAQAFSFKYSPRPGTPAAAMPEQVAPAAMDARLQELQAALRDSSLAFNRASLGRRCSVLIERSGRKPGQWLGKSPWLQSVHFAGPGAAVGDLVEVDLVEAGPNSVAGRLLAA
jgi:tRNA-2-methylthio-N6-dimethylallyladenosine synthase